MTTPKIEVPQGTWMRSTFEFPDLPAEVVRVPVEQRINNYTRRIRPDRILIITDVRTDARSTRVELIGRTVRDDGSVSARSEHLIYDEGSADRPLHTLPEFAQPYLASVLQIATESPLYLHRSSYEMAEAV